MRSIPVSNELRFLREFLSRPRQIASPVPSGRKLAQAIADEVDPRSGGLVLELGPGTGAVTRAICDREISEFELIAIESDRRFVALLRRQLPRVRIIEGDAYGFARLLGEEAAGLRSIVSGLPVIGQPLELRTALISGCMAVLGPGRPFVQYTYSPHPPYPVPEGIRVQRAKTFWTNLPPMHIWTYRQTGTEEIRNTLRPDPAD